MLVCYYRTHIEAILDELWEGGAIVDGDEGSSRTRVNVVNGDFGGGESAFLVQDSVRDLWHLVLRSL